MNPFNIMTIGSPAPATELKRYSTQVDDRPINLELVNILDISTPPIEIIAVDEWQTSSDVRAFESDEPRRIILPLALPQSRRHVDRNGN